MTDLQRIKEVIVVTAMYYGRDISPVVLNLMAKDLAHYTADQVERAYQAYRQNGKNRQFPLPAQIIEVLEGQNALSPNMLATKLIAAVKRHDYTWPLSLKKDAYKGGSFEAEFILELGLEAWHVVQLHGGWSNFCDSCWQANETTFKAQLRDLADSVIEKSKMGQLPAPESRPQIEHQERGGEPTSIGNLLENFKERPA